MRFFLVDRVDAIRPGDAAEGIKNITLSDEVLQDHFPDQPLMPGTLIVEALAQLGGFLVECSVQRPDEPLKRAVLARIVDAKFQRPCRPGDQLRLRCRLGSVIPGAAQIEGQALVGEELAASARLTFHLATIDLPQLHEERRRLYRTWTQGLTLDFPLP